MRSGQLRNRATLYRRTVTKDDYSEDVVTWTQYGSAWVSVTEQNADEQELAGRLVMATTALIKTRYRSDIVPQDRMTIAGERWEIAALIDTDMRHKETAMRCTKLQT